MPPTWAEWTAGTPASSTAVPVTGTLEQDSPLWISDPEPQSPPPAGSLVQDIQLGTPEPAPQSPPPIYKTPEDVPSDDDWGGWEGTNFRAAWSPMPVLEGPPPDSNMVLTPRAACDLILAPAWATLPTTTPAAIGSFPPTPPWPRPCDEVSSASSSSQLEQQMVEDFFDQAAKGLADVPNSEDIEPVRQISVSYDEQVPVHTLSSLQLSNMVTTPQGADQLVNTYVVTMKQGEPQEAKHDDGMMVNDKGFMLTGKSMLAGVRRHLQRMADNESKLRGVTCFVGYPVNQRWANLQLRSRQPPGTLPDLMPVDELHVPTGVCSMEEWPSTGKIGGASLETITHLYLTDKAGEPRSRTSITKKDQWKMGPKYCTRQK